MENSWQEELRCAVTSVEDLLAALELDKTALRAGGESKKFPLRVPRPYLARMRKGDPDDPLLRQVLPLQDENLWSAGYTLDPVNDLGAFRADGILRKYHGRVLLIVTGACAVHCRYCFRRHFSYSERALGSKLDAALLYIASDPSIEEVILSGGDPLSLSNSRLFELCQRIEDIPTVRRVRIHTRLPIVVPSRVDAEFSAWLKRRKKRYLVVFHINHPREIDAAVEQSVARFAGVTLLNQAVLLKGVNDDASTLAELSRRCFEAGILPYYLHLLDPVQGAAHFAVNDARALALMQKLAAHLPGYLVPRLARDNGDVSKIVLPEAIEASVMT